MVLTTSTMLPLGTTAPEFSLPDTKGTFVTRDDYKNYRGLLVVFMCNHCPYVKHIRRELVAIAMDYLLRGVAFVAINSNDINRFPEDGPEQMAKEARKYSYPFPYLYDEDQQVAKAYGASCTPDFFLFDDGRRLFYRGQMDDSRPGNGLPVTGKDLRAAIDALLEGAPAPAVQNPSVGCNIKWKEGSESEHFI
jgi:peroxiredoxin